MLGQPVTWITPYTFAHDVSTWAEHSMIRAGPSLLLSLLAERAEGLSCVPRAAEAAGAVPACVGTGGMAEEVCRDTALSGMAVPVFPVPGSTSLPSSSFPLVNY